MFEFDLVWFGLVWLSRFVNVFEFGIQHTKDHGQTCTKIETYKKKKKKENRMRYRVAAQLKTGIWLIRQENWRVLILIIIQTNSRMPQTVLAVNTYG